MEKPKPMFSTIVETDNELIIITPKKKSWIVVILLSVLTLQFSLGLFSVVFPGKELPIIQRVIMAGFYLVILYHAVKGIMWQVSGKNEMIIDSNILTTNSIGSIRPVTKVYKLSDIGLAGVKNVEASIGPFPMLQLLGITDRIKIVIGYGYETIPIIGDVDRTEALELVERINRRLKSSK